MDILSYLNEIIATRKEVGVPGLGTFYKKKSPGRYNADTHSFQPPSHVLSFTSEIKEQTALRDFIVRKENVDPENATFYIDQFSQDTIKQLERNEQVRIGELGVLSNSGDGYLFTPTQEAYSGFDFYGMPEIKETVEPVAAPTQPVESVSSDLPIESVVQDEQQIYEEISELQATEKVRPAIVIETPEGMAEEAPATIPEPSPVESAAKFDTTFVFDTPNEPEVVAENTGGMPGYLKIILAVSLIVIAGIVFYKMKPELFQKSQTAQMPPNEPAVDIVPDQNIDTAANMDTVALSGASQADVDTVKDSRAVLPQDTTISYEIIAASLLNQKEANNFLKEMERRGIPAKVAKMPGKRIKVSIGTFIDEEAANTQLNLLKKTTKIPGIYIYTHRHTNNIK